MAEDKDSLYFMRQCEKYERHYYGVNGYIDDWSWDESYDMLSFDISYTNTNPKTIKYISFYWKAYNDVNDLRNTGRFNGTGPVRPYHTGSWSWDPSMYMLSGDVTSLQISSVQITYMNGTKKILNGRSIRYRSEGLDSILGKLAYDDVEIRRLDAEIAQYERDSLLYERTKDSIKINLTPDLKQDPSFMDEEESMYPYPRGVKPLFGEGHEDGRMPGVISYPRGVKPLFGEVLPQFYGGDSALITWLNQHIHYPAIAQENDVEGRVVVQFIVQKDGSIGNVVIVQSVDPSLDQEAKRVVRLMPKWIPGKKYGKPVNCKITLPITFGLQDNKQVVNKSNGDSL